MVGTRKSAADVMGCSTDSLARYIREDVEPPFSSVYRLSVASGKSLDWIASGLGREEPALLDKFEAYLGTIELPPSPKQIAADPELMRIREELKGLTSARANLIKELVFGDNEGARKRRAQTRSTVENYKRSVKEWAEAVEAVGYKPSKAVEAHLQALLLQHEISAEEIIPLLSALNPRQSEE